MSDNRPIAYREGDTIVFRASSIGKPLRCLAAALQGYDAMPAPQYLIDAAEAGNRYEQIVIDRLLDKGYQVWGQQNEVEITVSESPHIIVRGHLDALHVIDPVEPTDRILEVKSMSARVFAKWIAHRFDDFPTYRAQLTAYMTYADRPALYAVIERDTDDMELIPYDSPPGDWDEYARRLMVVATLADMEQLPPCEGSEYSCPYDYLCDRLSPPVFEEVEDGSDTVLLRAIEKYEAARRAKDEIEARMADARDEITTALGPRDRVEVGGWKVSHVRAQRRSLDTRALRDRLGDEMDEFYKSTEYTQLRVQQPKEEEG